MPEILLGAPETLPPPEPSNFVSFSRVGAEVEMLVGYVDVKTVVDALQEGGEDSEEARTVPLHLTHRFFLGPDTFRMIREKVNHIYDKMVESGHLVEKDGENADA